MRSLFKDTHSNRLHTLTKKQKMVLVVLFSLVACGLFTNQCLVQVGIIKEPALVLIPFQLIIVFYWLTYAFFQFRRAIKAGDEMNRRRLSR